MIMADEATRALGPARRFIAIPFGGQRTIAALIDLVLVSALQLALGQVVGVVHPSGGPMYALLGGAGIHFFTSQEPVLAWPWLLAVVVGYFTLLEALFGATPGKAAMGLRVVNLEGVRPALRAVILRNLLRPVDAWPMFYLVGIACAAWSPRGQRLGDRAAGTLVVPAAIVPEGGMTRRGLLARLAVVVGLVAALATGALAFAYYGRPPLVVQGWANATNTVWFNSAAPETPPVCGPWQRQPDPLCPSGSFGYLLPRHIAAYALGAPTWGDGTVTYPLALELISAEQTDHGGTVSEPVKMPGLEDSDAYHGTIMLQWEGILGGWRVVGGELDC